MDVSAQFWRSIFSSCKRLVNLCAICVMFVVIIWLEGLRALYQVTELEFNLYLSDSADISSYILVMKLLVADLFLRKTAFWVRVGVCKLKKNSFYFLKN